MFPASRATHLLGTSVYVIAYELLRTMVDFGIFLAFFDLEVDLDVDHADYLGAALVPAVCSVALIGCGIVAAVMPLISPENGAQVTFIFGSLLLLIMGPITPPLGIWIFSRAERFAKRTGRLKRRVREEEGRGWPSIRSTKPVLWVLGR